MVFRGLGAGHGSHQWVSRAWAEQRAAPVPLRLTAAEQLHQGPARWLGLADLRARGQTVAPFTDPADVFARIDGPPVQAGLIHWRGPASPRAAGSAGAPGSPGWPGSTGLPRSSVPATPPPAPRPPPAGGLR